MNDKQKKAIEILTDVRQRYIDRMTDFVLENEHDLKDQADGNFVAINHEEIGDLSEKLRQLLIVLEAYRSGVQNEESSPEVAEQAQITFEMWESHVNSRQWEHAAAALSFLFNININVACQCMEWFASRAHQGHDMLGRTRMLRTCLKTNPSRAIQLLHDCFGLHGDAAVYVFHNLQQGTA